MSNYLPPDYNEVAERLKKFHADHAGSTIRTKVDLSTIPGYVLVQAEVDSGDKVGEGTSLGKLDGPKVLEKTETGAIGRALVHVGYPAQGGNYESADPGPGFKSFKDTAPPRGADAGSAGRLDGEAGRPAPNVPGTEHGRLVLGTNVPEAGGVAAQPASGTNVGVAGEGKTDTAGSTEHTTTTSAAPTKRTGGGETPPAPTAPAGRPASGTHSHHWTQSPTMKDWEVCSCGKAQKKGDRK